MPLSGAVTSVTNLALAFDRVVRGSNRDYKQYYRHLYPSYTLAQPALLGAISEELRKGTYQPNLPTLIYQPKKTGILRPLALLTLKDQIVYQAIVNRVADRMAHEHGRHALTRRFGALYASKGSPFFFRSWKVAYGVYNRAIAKAFNGGRHWVGEFDLVSCYELIDHNLLRAGLARRVRDPELLDLLGTCLGTWTTNSSGSHVRHGLPQGPEASAFLAECVLSRFDSVLLKDVTYLRYIDDIRLLARDEPTLRKALLRLDLVSKDLGLVPQAQKIGITHCKSVDEVIKTVPSSLVAVRAPGSVVKQSQLLAMWRKSLKKAGGRWLVDDPTRFRFAVYRMTPRRAVLRRNSQLLVSRPDLAPTLAYYFAHFANDREAADLLLAVLEQDPTYDASAAAYIEAMDICEPDTKTTAYRRVIHTTKRRSVEHSILIRIAALRFRAKRASAKEAITLLRKESNPHVVGLALARICAGAGGDPFSVRALQGLLADLVVGGDGDLARYAAALLIDAAAESGKPWKAPPKPNPAVADLLVALGLRSRGSTRRTAVELYFDRLGVVAPLKWKKALKGDLPDLERRVVRLQHLRLTDPSAFALMLDTFNEGLLQAFSKQHPTLASAFKAASGPNPHPDYGNWLHNGSLAATLPTSISWFERVHVLRLTADLAHVKHKKGPLKGKATKKISHRQIAAILSSAPAAWEDLIHEWQPIL